MNLLKALTIVGNLCAGCVVVAGGFMMLPDYLAFPWGLFNVYLWIVSPIFILWGMKKEEEKKRNEG